MQMLVRTREISAECVPAAQHESSPWTPKHLDPLAMMAGKRGRPEGRPKSGRKRPRRAAAPIRNARCCAAPFDAAVHKCKGEGRRGAMRSRLEPVTTSRPTQKGPALGRASKSFAESVWDYAARRG